MVPAEADKKLEGFIEWASKLGISDSPNNSQSFSEPKSCLGYTLTLSYFADTGGRGLGAARDLKKGELALSVPKSALFTKDWFLKDELVSSVVSNHYSLSPTQMLSACLLYEMGKGKSSFWYPYFLQLPRSYEILATFSEFEKQALQVEDAIWTAEKAISKAELEWKEALSLMQELKLKPQFLTLRAWIWASATISSRTMHIPWDEAGCLCPVGDFFNYAPPGEESNSLEEIERFIDAGFNEDIGAYCFYARQNYKRGEQVLLSYGTYTNLELLEHYGFVLNENPNDKVFIPLELTMYSSNSWPRESMYIHQDGKPSFALLSALRLWATPHNQRRSVGHLAYSGSQLSAENEMLVMNWISQNCRAVLNNLPTTVQEDSLLLSTIGKIQNLHNGIELRKMLDLLKDEFRAFSEANGMEIAELVLCGKTKRSIERWKLAVQWRLRYKKILIDCITYCSEVIISLSKKNDRTK
ncbi:protein SET DOMAIN GROUP 40 isoform X2 [Mercurialis annua]|uniref:protein SET DOMAIN GROUP 40 isoform X2 n=1 Tax=Mercurialis annua TaxID=3986 RepID=UPI0021600E48|nr:protein SET DOMAIN GROUP 40 isoform X2 [Mercurialis annua]